MKFLRDKARQAIRDSATTLSLPADNVLLVLVQDKHAGFLYEDGQHNFVFQYAVEYIAAGSPPIAPTEVIPYSEQPYRFADYPPFFANLLSEGRHTPQTGSQNEALTVLSILGAYARDVFGAVSLFGLHDPLPRPAVPERPHKLTDHPKVSHCLISLAPLDRPGYYAGRSAVSMFGRPDYVFPHNVTDIVPLLEHNHAQGQSLPGFQLKFSSDLIQGIHHRKEQCIIKPGTSQFPHLPANEHLTMLMAARLGLDTAACGLAYSADNELVYITKRFDRSGDTRHFFLDFAQLMSIHASGKNDTSLERVLETALTLKLSSLTLRQIYLQHLIAYLLGNEDLHLKNFGILSHDGRTYTAAPSYDMVNTTLYDNIDRTNALTVNSKRANIRGEDFLAAARNAGIIESTHYTILHKLSGALSGATTLIARSHLPPELKERYSNSVAHRAKLLGLPSIPTRSRK